MGSEQVVSLYLEVGAGEWRVWLGGRRVAYMHVDGRV